MSGNGHVVPPFTRAVEGNAESIENPLHEAAKRGKFVWGLFLFNTTPIVCLGNLPFLQECLSNRVSGVCVCVCVFVLH